MPISLPPSPTPIVQAEQRSWAQRRGPFGDARCRACCAAAVARRADAFDADERIDTCSVLARSMTPLEPGAKTARWDWHSARSARGRPAGNPNADRADHRRAAFVADCSHASPPIARTPCILQRATGRPFPQRVARPSECRKPVHHQRAGGGPTSHFAARQQLACGSEQIAARIRHQRVSVNPRRRRLPPCVRRAIFG